MLKSLVLLLSVVAASEACAQDARAWIGQIVPPYPAGWQTEGGSCLPGCTFSVGIVKRGEERLIYFGKAAPRRTPNTPTWTVLDAVPHPEVPKGYYLAQNTCQRGNRTGEAIIAVVRATNGRWHRSAMLAYLANPVSGRLEVIAPIEVRCLNEAEGL